MYFDLKHNVPNWLVGVVQQSPAAVEIHMHFGGLAGVNVKPCHLRKAFLAPGKALPMQIYVGNVVTFFFFLLLSAG